MFHALPQHLRLSEIAEIYAWRLMLHATRLTQRVTGRWAPIVLPVLPLLWIPVMALVFGGLVGWSIVR